MAITSIQLKVGDSSLRSEWQAFRPSQRRRGWLEFKPPTTLSLKNKSGCHSERNEV